MHDCRGICSYAIAQRRFESHLVSSVNCRFIESMTHTAHYTVYVQLPVRAERDLQQNFTL